MKSKRKQDNNISTTGKRICEILKDIRKEVGDTTDGLNLQQSECTFKGECSGTCPKCESELQEINNKLSHKDLVDKVNNLANQARIDRETNLDMSDFDLDILGFGEGPLPSTFSTKCKHK
jgi:hypothetical protein